jgi:uncharacterized membrane protein YphA (DoxX/SURF4 family)
MSIYVEILIRGHLDEVWDKTQQPKLHQRWDLRFSEIDYLTREHGEPQKFLYATRIGGGLRIQGSGESSGEHDDSSGQRTSALKFWSDDPKSLIFTGSGYWKYIPASAGIRFLTWYDYRVRFGSLGKLVDRVCFRPLLGWATAWSFDRLRLWIERSVPPELARTGALVYSLSRIILAFVWLYHGLVPKLLFRNIDEARMVRNGVLGISPHTAVTLSGWSEIVFAVVILLAWKSRWPLWLTILLMIVATMAVGLMSPEYLTHAFNPVTLNISVASLASIALLVREHVPFASNCLRKPREGEQ